jgi:hypothetical protein
LQVLGVSILIPAWGNIYAVPITPCCREQFQAESRPGKDKSTPNGPGPSDPCEHAVHTALNPASPCPHPALSPDSNLSQFLLSTSMLVVVTQHPAPTDQVLSLVWLSLLLRLSWNCPFSTPHCAQTNHALLNQPLLCRGRALPPIFSSLVYHPAILNFGR